MNMQYIRVGDYGIPDLEFWKPRPVMKMPLRFTAETVLKSSGLTCMRIQIRTRKSTRFG